MSFPFLLRRLVLVIPTLIGVSIIVFVLLRVVPGDPIMMMIPPGATEDDIDHLRHLYGLDKPIVEQYLVWFSEVLKGDFDTSISLRQDVVELILSRLPATIELAVAAMFISVILGTLLALIGTFWSNRWPETIVDGFTGLNQAIPDFLWGLIFILAFGVLWPLLPVSGRIDPRISLDLVSQFYIAESLIRGEFSVFLTLIKHMIMPAIALALPLTAVIARSLKASLRETMTQDYIRMAQIKGFGPWRILIVEALRNAMIPTVALSGVQFNFLLGGTVLIERIFSYPGIGNMSIGAVIDRDLPLIQGLIITFAILFIITNLVIDMSYRTLNPRVRNE
ncbi:MAG: ABC transporter permease [Gammaproteobacteria bacterium]|nr:ABC transporter permease [Gammaproteobacteria bacterium]